MIRFPSVLRLAMGLLFAATPASAQFATTPHAAWRTITTPHFRIHHPVELEAWARDVAGRMEGIRTAVGTMVAYTPPQVIEIIVEDPVNQTNGSALPLQRGPSIRLWPVPPEPGQLGHYTGWGELVAVHEYAHLAHLLRPGRASKNRIGDRLSPIALSPIVTKAPAWIFEGYATVIEGRLTGSGRPNGVFRPAILRQLALEGALPRYDQLDNTAPFLGGAMRYLVGSAFLEWLADRDGWTTHEQLWRRLTAKRDRSFVEAFEGVYGEKPDRLYGRFVAEVTAKAVAAERVMAAPGEVKGAYFQQLDWFTSGASVSPDGKLVAVQRSAPGKPAQVVILAMEPKPETARGKKAREEAAKRDPEDVAARRVFPAPRETIATLAPMQGTGWDRPRFFADGKRILALRAETFEDGTSARDLWIWDRESQDVRRVTHGAAIRSADPFPDGTKAAGIRCRAGTCDVVTVELDRGDAGELKTLAAGSFEANFAGVRVSPDGRSIATARQQNGRWQVVTVDAATGAVRVVSPSDGVSRYEPTWTPDGSALIVVSEAAGTPQLERLALDGTTRPVTRFAGLTGQPEVGRDGTVWFLTLHARGYDLRTVALDSAARGATVVLADSLAPVAPRQRTADARAFPTSAVTSEAYGLGRIGATWLPNAGISAEGQDQGGVLSLSDAVGRFGAVLQGGYGQPAVWRGGSLALTWRGVRPSVTVAGFSTRHLPTQQRIEPLAIGGFDAEYAGASMVAERTVQGTGGALALRGGLSTGRVRLLATPGETVRQLAAVRVSGSRLYTPKGRARITPSFAFDASAGRSFDVAWRRTQLQGGLAISSWSGVGLDLQAMAGTVSGDAPTYEQFALGGAESPYVDPLLLQGRWAAPGQAFGALTGTRAFRARAALTGALAPFVQVDRVGSGGPGEVRRLVGFESALTTPSLPVARIPGTRTKFGVAMPLDGPAARRAVFYTTIVLTP